MRGHDDERVDVTDVVYRESVPTGSGLAFTARAGQTVRFSLAASAQVIDLNVFRLEDPRERFSSSVTRPIHGTHLTKGDTLLTCPPWERPIADVVGDSLRGRVVDHDGVPTRSHDLLFGRCSAALRRHLYGSASPGCQEILADAIEPHGLTELDVHDPINIFMRTGIDADGRLFFADPVAVAGDSFEVRLRMDSLLAMSCCPGRSSGPAPGGAMVTVSGEIGD